MTLADIEAKVMQFFVSSTSNPASVREPCMASANLGMPTSHSGMLTLGVLTMVGD